MLSKRTLLVCSYDLLTIPLAWILAYWIRFNFNLIPQAIFLDALKFLPAVIIVQAAVFYLFGLYRGRWRFASVPDLVRIIKAVVSGALCILLVLFLYPKVFNLSHPFPPRSVFLLYILILIALLAGARLFFRWQKDFLTNKNNHQRILIIGAGAAGATLARDLLCDKQHCYRPVVYVDDDFKKIGMEIYGIRVVGVTNDIPQIVRNAKIDLILIAIPSATGKIMRRLVDLCNIVTIPYRTLPALSALASGEVKINDLRNVSLEDLLGREPINLQDIALQENFQQLKIMITGGGGSIGAELCRQLAKFKPAELILVDNSEFNLYSLDKELRKTLGLNLKSYLQDITDKKMLINIMQQCQPDIVFHAAAYKHVPLLETQICVAVKNNIIGTRCVAETAVVAKVKKFVLISTDKAVNPTNVMGTTKRVAEIFCQNYNKQQDSTRFMAVRFGNVLGSAGSVVPLFKQQLEQGGPITVTHPDITRYFMTIPEASQLILRASVMGKGGEIYVLDMGEPIKIIYLAKQLIKLSGKKLGEDIDIVVTGLRPGEKLFEELFHESEILQPTAHEKIMQADPRQVSWQALIALMDNIQHASLENDTKTLLELLTKIVPENKIIIKENDV